MRLINADGSETNIYTAADNALEKVTFYRATEGLWYAVVNTLAPPELAAKMKVGTVRVAYAFDGSEKSDRAVIQWAQAAYQRATHPEDEVDEAV